MRGTMSQAVYVFAGGGTGGHLFPGLAVAEALRRRDPQARIVFLTTDRGLDRRILEPTGFEQVPQPVRPFRMSPWHWPAFWRCWRSSRRLVVDLLDRYRPRAVLGLGGFAAGPPVVAARRAGLRTAILNPDVIPGRANRFLARRADLVVLEADETRHRFPEGTPCVVWGCPVREAFRRVRREDGCRRFGLDPRRKVLLVTGASQGARTINRVMWCAWPEFARRHHGWQLLHLTGPADESDTRRTYEAAGTAARVLAFTPAMADAMAAADVVLCRAGASTLAELATVGRPAILMPYPFHRDRHQHANARRLVDAGAAIMLEDHRDAEQDLPQVLDALERLADDNRRRAMARAAADLAHPDAAERIATWMARACRSGSETGSSRSPFEQ